MKYVEIARRMRYMPEWDMKDCRMICRAAGMEDEWDASDADNFIEVLETAAKKLKVHIYPNEEAMISLDNGRSLVTAVDAMPEIEEHNLWDTLVNAMDDDLREQIAFYMNPCTNLEFLTEYLERAYEDLVI